MSIDFLHTVRSSEGLYRFPEEMPPVAPGPERALPSAIIGASVPRVDGPLKTTGTAKYAADYHFPDLVYAVPVCSTITHGKIVKLDSSKVEAMPGVLLVLHHGNIMPLYRNASGGRNSENRPPFHDEVITYWGQYVAAVVAETFEQAQAAAAAVQVTYSAEKFNVDALLNDPLPEVGAPGGPRVTSHRGDSEKAFDTAAVTLDEMYSTPAETHNPMEMHATVAVWKEGKYTLYESSQGIMNHQTVMAQVLGEPKENVEIISRFIGSGFGGKLWPWPHSAIAAAAAKQLNRPVKLSLGRKMMFTNVGHRTVTQQRMRLGATVDGKLVSLQHDFRVQSSILDETAENCGEVTPYMYSVPNLKITSGMVRRHIGVACPMRGPGAVPGVYAIESAMDELAIKLKKDPVAFRLSLDTLTDEEENKPFSSRNFKECLTMGAEKFGWSHRTPSIGSMRKGDRILGWGVAGGARSAHRNPGQATASFLSDGTAQITSATQDIGTGTYTVMAQVLSDKTGVPFEKIQVIAGSSSLPPGPNSGGSTATASIIGCVADAGINALAVLLGVANTSKGTPLTGKGIANLTMTNGRVHVKETPPADGIPFAEILKGANLGRVDGDGKSVGLISDPKTHNYSTQSFGAVFAEVEWDPGIARLRVSRVVSVIDGGRIMNKRTATNQVAGGIVMGVGMALLEDTTYDTNSGHPINDSFADYVVPTIADGPDIDVHFLDIPDYIMGDYGARGIAEVALAGVAPAITAAVYHATGIRVRNLPVRIEDLLTAPETV
jgi:xanthine dehydrogenase YagR molybdenum-binding subunit